MFFLRLSTLCSTGERSAGASVIRTVTLLVVPRVTVSKVMSKYRDHEKTASAKRNSGRKSTLTERDRSTLRRVFPKKNHRDTAAQVSAELIIRFEDPFP
jgi:hypothetical protein